MVYFACHFALLKLDLLAEAFIIKLLKGISTFNFPETSNKEVQVCTSVYPLQPLGNTLIFSFHLCLNTNIYSKRVKIGTNRPIIL
jgi:hypothetical protein